MSKEVTKEQIGSIVSLLVAGKVPHEVAQAIIDKYKNVPSKKKRESQSCDEFRIMVVSAFPPTYAELIAYYGEMNTSRLFRYEFELHESLRDLTPPTGEIRVFVKKFDRGITSKKAINWADENNYRLVYPWEREAFSKANSDLLRKFLIADLGSSVFDLHGNSCVPVLLEYCERLTLDCNFDDIGWFADDRFLFASK